MTPQSPTITYLTRMARKKNNTMTNKTIVRRKNKM
jgi:hypothetical protein